MTTIREVWGAWVTDADGNRVAEFETDPAVMNSGDTFTIEWLEDGRFRLVIKSND